jgi:5'-AMP-activated protein kinase catalytic alpha subunit
MSIKIADFGISGVADQFNPDFDAGTLKYMAPEVLSAKEKSNTPAVDVWACGVILYYMVFGCLPFKGTHTSQIIQLICKGNYTFPEEPNVS